MNFPEVFSLVALSICSIMPLTPSWTGTGAALIPALLAAWLPSYFRHKSQRGPSRVMVEG